MQQDAQVMGGEEKQLVLFRVADQTYGLDIHCVQRLLAMPRITRIPGAAGCIAGVTEVRGEVVPLLDMRRRLGCGQFEAGEDGRVVIVETSAGQVGLMVDAVTEVFRLPVSSIEMREQTSVSIDDEIVRGIGKDGDRLIILLDNEKLLRAHEQAQADEMTHQAGQAALQAEAA